MTTYKLSRDRNGNKVVKVRPPESRGFSIQTLGNCPKTHRDGLSPSWTPSEVSQYVRAHGTQNQRDALGIK